MRVGVAVADAQPHTLLFGPPFAESGSSSVVPPTPPSTTAARQERFMASSVVTNARVRGRGALWAGLWLSALQLG
eukprot:14713573-Alexandrium_andersonii.AAC.1